MKQTSILPNALLKVEEHLCAFGENQTARLLAELRVSLDHPDLRVVIFGEFNRGKSTLINALLGGSVLPTKLIPTTGHVTQISYGARDEVRVRMVGGLVETCGLDRLASFSSLNHESLARDDIESIEVVVNCPLLRDRLVLVDTPGVNEKDAQTRRARQAIAKADLVLFVLDASKLLSSDERGLAIDWLCKELGKPVVPVVNFMNRIGESDRRDVRRRMDQWCRGNLFPALGRSWFESDAKTALVHALGKGPAPTDDFVAMQSALKDCSGQMRRDLQRLSRNGQLRAEVRAVRLQNRGILTRIYADAAKEEEERAAKDHDLQEFSRRFAANASVQRDRLCLLAQQTPDQKLDALINRFSGKTKSKLESKAARWYGEKLMDATYDIEKEADQTLLVMSNGRTPPARPTLH